MIVFLWSWRCGQRIGLFFPCDEARLTSPPWQPCSWLELGAAEIANEGLAGQPAIDLHDDSSEAL